MAGRGRAGWDTDDKVAELRGALGPLAQDADLAPWTDNAALRRYLRAREGDVSKAASMLTASLEWRRSASPHTTRCPKCEAQPLSHNMRIVGFDGEKHPVMYTCFGQAHDRFDAHCNSLHLTMCLENAERLMREREAAGDPIADRWVWFVDYEGYALRDNSPKTMMLTLHLLNHYPERLHRVIMYGAPWIFGAVWSGVRKLLNAETASKVTFAKGDDVFDSLGVGPELASWLRAECAQNRRLPSAPGGGVSPAAAAGEAKRYWERPADPAATDAAMGAAAGAAAGGGDEHGDVHDPRAVKSYTECSWFVSPVAPLHLQQDR